jgi:hypothetical protein
MKNLKKMPGVALVICMTVIVAVVLVLNMEKLV